MTKFNLFAWYGHLSSREQRILQAAVGFVLVLLLDVTVFSPVSDLYVSLKGQISEAEGTLTRNLINLRRKEVVESGYNKYRSLVRPGGSDEEENAGLLSEIEQVARAQQVVLVDMKPREVKSGQFHKEYVAELDGEAEMKNLIAFMHALEQSSQLMRVMSVKLTPKEAKSAVVKARMTVIKTVFLGGL